jgi:hypothetical protein
MIAPVETSRYFPVFRSVLFEVGVEEIERNPPHPHPPDLDFDLPPREIEVEKEGDSLSVLFQVERQVVEIVFRVELLLPPLDIEVLPEIALAVQETNPDQGDAEVTGGFQVVSGKDAEPSGINGQ